MLRTVLLAASSWLGGPPALAAIVGQATGGDAPTPLASLVYGALGSSPAALILAWMVTRADKVNAELRSDLQKERDENRRINELRIDKAEDMATRLERAASTFQEIKAGMDAELGRARPADEWNRTLQELRSLVQQRSRGERP